MKINSTIETIVSKSFDKVLPSAEEIALLLEVEPHSLDAGHIMAAADAMSRRASGGIAEVHAQIGLNLSPCPRDCAFCAFAARNHVFDEAYEFAPEDVVRFASRAERDGANAIFVMATGDYPFGKYIEMSEEIRRALDPATIMIANVGDFSISQGKKLRDAGYSGIYHAVRMGEGRDTTIPPETRLKTVRAAREAGLLVGTCVEPVGPEHTTDEIVEKTLIGRDMNPCYSGSARRITIPGSGLEHHGMISEYEMAYIVAVLRIAMGPDVIGNCTHEPNILGASAGANLFWAEGGANPRDTETETTEGRGLDAAVCRKMFEETDWELVDGPSRIYGYPGA
jgi:biotin synthase